ncbi:MAG: hypothetical protein EBT07_04955 [Actinobacteria bacterium]|nr:hypothetical protein [Actinomycetota bacterium]
MSVHIGLIVTGDAVKDFQIFVQTLEVWNPHVHLYIYTDSATVDKIRAVKPAATWEIMVRLDDYCGKNRKEMEATKGKIYDSLFTDYTYEKANLLEWMLERKDIQATGAWFMDADITHLGPLPKIPESATLALSPHYIRTGDEAKFGKYNAGFMWFRDARLLSDWKEAGKTTRFFEQAPLEDIAKKAEHLYEFPIQVNFGWWRMFQSAAPPPDIQAKFSLFRAEKGIGIRYDGVALQSIHTHWHQNDRSPTTIFNQWIRAFCERYKIHKPLQNFQRIISN